MVEQQDITVEIENTPPPGEQQQQADPVADLKAQFDELQEQKKRESDQRAAAERRASDEATRRAQAEQAARDAATEAAQTQLTSLDQQIEAATREREAAMSEYQAAMEAGDWKKSAEAQKRMNDAGFAVHRNTEKKAELEAGGRRVEQRQQPQQRQTTGDPTEDLISRCEPNTAQWLRSHMDDARALATGSDPRRQAKLMAADNDAKAEGYAPGSNDYFAHVEKFLGMNKQTEPPTKQQAPAARKPSPPVAPVQQSGGGVSGSGDVVRLSAREAAAATDGTHVWNYPDPSGQNRWKKGDPIGVQEFARRKKAMQEQGLYDKTLLEQ